MQKDQQATPIDSPSGGPHSHLVSADLRKRLEEALGFSGPVSGLTHGFYPYPARFSPAFARIAITEMSQEGDWVLDPFMGGGTSIVEGIAAGRRMIGIDINTLARFFAEVKTRPLTPHDVVLLREWAEALRERPRPPKGIQLPGVRNLPSGVERFMAGALSRASELLLYPRQHRFARCALLRLGHWALDGRESDTPDGTTLATRLSEVVKQMIEGLDDFVSSARKVGLQKNQITSWRHLIHGSTAELDVQTLPAGARGRIRLVVTSPPYPQVHVLYHRWQLNGRRETPAPYWIAGTEDGSGASYYTFGSRTPTGLRNYFDKLRRSFSTLRPALADDATVLQLVSFPRPEEMLPRFLEAMSEAGYREAVVGESSERLERDVPNRKWYVRTGAVSSHAVEVLLAHHPV